MLASAILDMVRQDATPRAEWKGCMQIVHRLAIAKYVSSWWAPCTSQSLCDLELLAKFLPHQIAVATPRAVRLAMLGSSTPPDRCDTAVQALLNNHQGPS